MEERMEKIVAFSPTILTIICSVVPLSTVIGEKFNYRFALYNERATITIIGLFMLIMTMAMTSEKNSVNRCNRIFAIFLLPAALLNDFFFLGSVNGTVAIFMVVCFVCALVIFGKFAESVIGKIISGVVSVLLLMVLVLLVPIFLFFQAVGGFGITRVVRMEESPDHTYIAEIIDDDQGGMGGNTLVYVRSPKIKIPLGIGEFTKSYEVYRGEWGEYRSMDIFWKDNTTLVINETEYDLNDL